MAWRARTYDGASPQYGKRPAVVGGGASGMSLHNRRAHIDIAARGVGIGAHLVGFLDQGFRIGAGKAGQRDGEVDVEAKAAGRARADADRRGYRGVRRYLGAALRGDEFHRADEAGG